MDDETKKLELSRLSPWDSVPDQIVAAFPEAFFPMKHDRLAHEIGRFVFAWSQLESAIGILVQRLVSLRDDSDFFAFMAVFAGLDIYKKADALIAIGAHVKPNEKWFDELQMFRKKLDGPLRDKRNRIVHDFWLTDRDEIEQLSFKARFNKDTGRPEIMNTKQVPIDEVVRSTITLYLCGMLIKRLHDEFVSARCEG